MTTKPHIASIRKEAARLGWTIVKDEDSAKTTGATCYWLEIVIDGRRYTHSTLGLAALADCIDVLAPLSTGAIGRLIRDTIAGQKGYAFPSWSVEEIEPAEVAEPIDYSANADESADAVLAWVTACYHDSKADAIARKALAKRRHQYIRTMVTNAKRTTIPMELMAENSWRCIGYAMPNGRFVGYGTPGNAYGFVHAVILDAITNRNPRATIGKPKFDDARLDYLAICETSRLGRGKYLPG